MGLSDAELSAITAEDVTVASVKALLIKEHNDSQHRGKHFSFRQQLTYLRTHIQLEEKRTGNPILKIGDLSKELRNQFLVWTGLKDSTLYQRIVIPLATEQCFKAILAVLDANSNSELQGQTKNKKVKELPVKALESLFKLNDSESILQVLRNILQLKEKPESIGPSATLLWYKKNAVDHVVRGVNWKPGLRDKARQTVKKGFWRWPGSFKDFDQLCSEFPQVVSTEIISKLFSRMEQLGDISKVKKPISFEFADEAGYRPPHKQIKLDLSRMPNTLADFIEKAQQRIDRLTTGEEAVKEVGQEQEQNIITFENTRQGLYSGTSVHLIRGDLSQREVFDSFNDLNLNYVAAFLELPDDMVQGNVDLIIANIVHWTVSPTLAVQVWCAPKQEQFVAEVMSKHLKRVERCFWWKPICKQNPKKFQDDDVRVGYVGHSDLSKSRFHSNISTSVVVAPESKPFKNLKRMNGLVSEQFFQRHATEGDLVADFMCGSGAASIAAVGSGLSCLSVDINSEMVCCLPCFCCVSYTTFLFGLVCPCLFNLWCISFLPFSPSWTEFVFADRIYQGPSVGHEERVSTARDD